MLFIVVNALLKCSFWKRWQVGIFSLACGIFIVLSQQYAIQQSKTQIIDYLDNIAIRQDMAVLITIESALCFAFCFVALMIRFGKRPKSWGKLLHWYPSLLLFPTLFYLQTQTIFALTGTSFSLISWSLAAGVTILLPILSYGIKWLMPEEEFRLEVHFIVSLFVAILGLITTVNGNVTYAAVKEPINWQALILSLVLFTAMFLLGYWWNNFKWKKKQLKEK